jgi:hypothetical protein
LIKVKYYFERAVQQFNSNTTGVTSETGTANPSRAHELTLVLSRVRDARGFQNVLIKEGQEMEWPKEKEGNANRHYTEI